VKMVLFEGIEQPVFFKYLIFLLLKIKNIFLLLNIKYFLYILNCFDTKHL
jgi:hypothetical protein